MTEYYQNTWRDWAQRIEEIDNETNTAPTAPHAICLAALFYAKEMVE